MGLSNDASHRSRLRQAELPLLLSPDLRMQDVNVLQPDTMGFDRLGIRLDNNLLLCFASCMQRGLVSLVGIRSGSFHQMRQNIEA